MPDWRSKSCRVSCVDVHVKSASVNFQTGSLFATFLAPPSKLKTCEPVRFSENGEYHQSLMLLTAFFSQKEPRVSIVSVCVPAPQPRKIVPEFSVRPPTGARTVTSFDWKSMMP